jgi:uncharacterized protein
MITWSMFNLFIDDSDHLIIRNTLTTTTVRITKKTKEEIDKSLSFIDCEYLDNLKDSTNQENTIKILLDKKILVDSLKNEKKEYKELFLKYRQEDKVLALYITTTLDCQLDCPYCFEGNNKTKEYMTKEDADKIKTWTTHYLNKNFCDKIRVIFYGGEPLLNKKLIRYILPKLKNIADEKKLSFETGILTNGEFFDLEIGKFLKKYNLNKIQITLDGPENCHNARRHRKKSKKGTFQKIINNIFCLIENDIIEKIDIRINFDKQNISFIPELFDLFVDNKIEKRISLSFGIITPTIYINTKNYFEENTLGQTINAEKYLWLCSEAKKRGFSIPKEFLSGPWCATRKTHSAVILPRGNIVKCISLVGRNDFIFGNINNCDNLEDEQFTNFEYISNCLEQNCPLVPICGGGCRFEAYLSKGDFSKPHCQRKMVETINKGLVLLNYK